MAIEITVPRLGWSMDEGTLTEWLKRDGEFVRKGEMLFVLEGDKAAQEIECFDEGILKQLPDGPQPGDTVRVGQLLAYLLAEGEQAPSTASSAAKSSAIDVATSERHSINVPTGQDQVFKSQSATGNRASPRARRAAAEFGVDWTKVIGTGKSGRVREKDVLMARGHVESATAVSTGSEESSAILRQPISPLRRTIAERMLASHQATAPVTLTSTADATNLVRLRTQFQTVAEVSQSLVPSFTDMIVKLTGGVLQSHPLLNARWLGEAIVMSREVHIGIAVETENGLMVPVVRNVEQLTLLDLAARTRDLIAKARSRRLTSDAMQGGTFTVTNLGSYGIDAFTPIIQLPQCAILGIGRIYKAPVFLENQFVPRDMLTLSLTFDHRIVDGAPAARFLQAICKVIEEPEGSPLSQP